MKNTIIQTNKKYLPGLLNIAVPIMLSNLISQLQMLIDRIFLGHVNSMYMSALGNVTSPMWTTMSFCFSIVTGASILISQSVGAGDNEHIEEYSGAMVKYNNIIPILLFFFWTFCAEFVFRLMGVSDGLMPMCLDYSRYYAPVFLITGLGGAFSVILQTSNYTKPLVIYGILRSGVNIFLDWVMIFGRFGLPAMGIKGAAIATTIAEYSGLIFAVIFVVSSKKLNTKPSMKWVLKAHIKPYLLSAKLGVNTALEDFAWNLGNLLLIRILNAINEMAAGIYSIIFSVEVLAVVIIGAIGNGTMTLTGEAKGNNDLGKYKGVCVCAYGLCIVVGIITLGVCLAFPQQIISLFTNDKSIIASCGIYRIFISINLFAKSANIVVGNAIRGSGNTIWMLITQLFGTVWVVSVALLFVFVLKLGIAGVFLAVIVDEIVRSFINLGKYLRIVKNWESTDWGKESLI
ncbi:MATE family efflux transporter [Coprococcus sp. TF11-13]|uniref:MATE family efflux transporter n=1 Tax=Coprococcus sp. TF11-13 TaxID=2293096 RepID=UPI000E53FF4A|nr:MATE family efflux transporter [Coprococcus sp. TF11-13]RHU53892.1 MATE family efflux transporter [Coprococcus sp. TF11-13]